MTSATEQTGGHHHNVAIPRILLLSCAAMILFTIAAVLVGRTTGAGAALTPPSPAVETREIAYVDAGGEMVLRDAETGEIIRTFGPDEGGFVRGVLRGLYRGRALQRVAGGETFLLMRRADGRISIVDPATDERFDLNSFGSDNLATFATLLASQEEVR